MKNSLYASLLSRLKNKHAKLASRFHKSVKEGEFQKQRFRKQRDAVERLKNIEKRIAVLGAQTGFNYRLNYKHWAVALAMGVVVSASAQQKPKEDFKTRLKQHANQVINDIQPLAQSVFFEPKVGLGVPLFNQFHTGDLDGDGDLDALYVPYLESPLILTNEGSFNFSISALTNTPLEIVEQTILADFDGDGDLDLFMRNGTYGAIGVQMWVNDGAGSFTSQAVTFPNVNFDDDRLTVADIDGDGDLDFVGETRQDSPSYDFVTVFNNVSFDFSDTTAYKGSYMFSQSSHLISPMDVDGDLDIDIVYHSYLPSFSSYGVQILENDGSGNFSQANSSLAPTNNFNDGSVPIDFDNDGDLDFLTFPSGISGVRVRPFTSNGTIPTDGSSPFTEGTDVVLSASVNDNGEDIFPMRVDTDAFEDFVANTEDSTFVFISNGAGLFSEQIRLAGQSKPGDLDADGDADLFFFDGNLSIRDNQGAGAFAQRADILTISSTYDTKLVDLDGDGDLDLAQGGGSVSRSWINDGSGNFTIGQEFPGNAYQLAFGDLDGDSDMDMVVALEGDSQYPGFIIYTNDGAGNLTYNSNLGTGYETDQVFLADMDEDGDMDIVARQDGVSNDYIRIYDNQGSLTFSLSSSIANAGNSKMNVENIDGDSDKDIVLAAEELGITTIINNTGTLAAGSTFTPLGSNFSISDVDLADLDGDGDMDIFASNGYDSPTAESYVFINNGSGTFTDNGQNVATGSNYASFLGDIDSDGDVDVVSGGYISYPKLWVNDGSANFAFDHDIPTIATEYSSVNIGDLDGDGDQDIVIGDYYGGTNIFFNSSLIPNPLEPDSLALVDIFDTMDGANWTDATNWKSGDVSTWFGVTLNTDGDRVERLELPNNGLSGTLPAAVDQLAALEILDVSDNDIDALGARFSTLTSALDINLNGNRLDFGDLEAVGGVAVLSYTNQQELVEGIIENGPIEIPVGSTQALTSNVNGSANTYQWTYDGDDILGATTANYSITNIDRSNMGLYGLDINNSIATGLTLSSTPIEVLATSIITVNVTDDSDVLLTENVNGYLLEIEEGEVGFDTLSIATQENVSSSFSFPAVVLGDFLVNVSSDEALYVPTYYSDAFLWDEADTLKLNSDSIIQVTITEVPPVLTPADGEGLVNGSIEEDFEDDASRIDARRRAAKRKCGLRRKRSGGRTGQSTDEFELIAYGETNDNGEFEYGFLPEGTYRFFVEYPGVPLDESAFVQFDVGEAGVGDNSFRLAVFASEDGIFIELVLGLTSPHFSDFKIFPNPTADLINIDYTKTGSANLSLEVYDLNGREMLRKSLKGDQKNVTIDISNFEKGQYIFRVIDENRKDLVVYKIIKN
ncbi:MAG: FG-GAP-like repeat-containing protein [Ekhidna sp.]